MKRLLLSLVFICILMFSSIGQTPVVMSTQAGFSYTENFADINNWIFNTTPSNGTFAAGIGSQAWKGIDVTTTTLAIPNASRITVLSNFFQTPGSSGGVPTFSGGLYKGTQSIRMLSTGQTDNSSSIGLDFFLDFTSVNAGTLSFDWASLNNNTGNRNGTLRVYASTDGIAFTEITAAQVLNFTNNSPTVGSVANVTLPSIFNGSATARLRFYYHNASGGTFGSRPRINLDNVKVTALPTTLCVAPTVEPSSFIAGTVLYNLAQFSFTAANPTPDNYLVVMSKNNALSSYPVNNTVYNIGDNLGDGTVVAISNTSNIAVTGLTNSTTYYFFIFSMNNVCSAGPLYSGLNPLIGSVTTLAGQLPCVAPTNQPTNLVLSNVTINSVIGSFAAALNTDEYLIIRSLSPTFTGTLNNGTLYNGGNVLGNGSVVTRTAGTSFTSQNLANGTAYFFFVFGLNSQNCNAGPVYKSNNPLTASATTIALPICVSPTVQPTQLNLIASNDVVNGYFVSSPSADGYLVVRSTNATLSSLPTNAVTYVTGNSIGGGTVVASAISTSFIDINLTSSTQYYYFVFAKNSNCTGGIKYLTTNPLTASATTTAIATNKYYFGNLHAHSSYSDGNVDNTALTPADNYAYAKNSMCMDFLGISEHNHLMSVNNWIPGLNQAAAASTSNFLALYGMEYGVISNGGHVLIYGSNQLIGWTNNNYNLYVPQSNYIGTPESTGVTGLFRTINNINNQLGNPAFASFAHPDFSDYNNLANIPFNATADSATIGCAIASGPAFSTNTTYSNPPTSMAYLDYYNRMLARGYHIGPFMDHDSHYTNFGRSSNNRLAVVAPSLSSTDFFAAMKGRHFYATEDCDTKVNFTLNNELMGSISAGVSPPAISLNAVDPTSPSSIPNIKIMYGVVGSGILPVQVANASGYTLSFTDNNLAVGAVGYYYGDITIAGNRTITAPIWYTKASTVPVKFHSFNATLNTNRTVNLKWKTANEVNHKMFIVEKSSGGVLYTPIETIVTQDLKDLNSYSAVDYSPNEGVNYYRLKQIDINNKYSYSRIIAINVEKYESNAFSIFPNPVNDLLSLKINSTSKTKANIVITDVSGREIKVVQLDLIKGFQSTSIQLNGLKQGVYFIRMSFNNQMITERFVKL